MVICNTYCRHYKLRIALLIILIKFYRVGQCANISDPNAKLNKLQLCAVLAIHGNFTR